MRPTAQVFTATLCALLAAMAEPATAADEVYPNRVIKIVVPFPAGGSLDAVTRILAEKVGTKFGQPVILDNRAGASGNIGAEIVAHARADGYTLLSTPPPPLVINQNLYRLSFDPTTFVPITLLGGAPNVLVAHPKLRADSAGALITLAKEQPGTLNYASTGSGGTPHLTTEWFKSAAAIEITHIPYQGSQAYTALLAGDVDVMFVNLSDALPYIRSGRFKALAIASEKRNPALPGVPTLAETIPGFASSTWFAVVATPGTPPGIAEKLSAAFNEALRLPEVEKRLAELNLEPLGGSPAQTSAFLKNEAERWKKVIRAANVKVD